MRTWFAHKTAETPSVSPLVAAGPIAVTQERTPRAPRRMIYAPVINGDPAPLAGDTIRVKAQLDANEGAVVLMVDRPLLAGYSYLAKDPTAAATYSPLAKALLEYANVNSVLIHAMNVTVSLDSHDQESLELCARQLGQAVRVYLQAGQAVMTETFFATMPSEDEIRDALQAAIDDEISPGISGHSGEITLTNLIGNTAYIKMGGGCQGCAASSITLRHGIDQSFRRAVPQLGALLDETDHSAGSNPFFTELPAEMRG